MYLALSGGVVLFCPADEARLTIDMPMPYAIYILLCSDRTYYAGLTRDLDGRVHEHKIGTNPDSYTFSL
jgi:hypothetical protein